MGSFLHFHLTSSTPALLIHQLHRISSTRPITVPFRLLYHCAAHILIDFRDPLGSLRVASPCSTQPVIAKWQTRLYRKPLLAPRRRWSSRRVLAKILQSLPPFKSPSLTMASHPKQMRLLAVSIYTLALLIALLISHSHPDPKPAPNPSPHATFKEIAAVQKTDITGSGGKYGKLSLVHRAVCICLKMVTLVEVG